MNYRCYLCQHEWEDDYLPRYKYVECPNCKKHIIEVEARVPKDAYWNAKDEFEHDIKELFGQFISPEEFEGKWRPRLQDSNNSRKEKL